MIAKIIIKNLKEKSIPFSSKGFCRVDMLTFWKAMVKIV